MARAMRAVDPSIQITAVGQIHDPDPTVWNETVLRQAGQQIDLLSVHHYFTGSFAPAWWHNNPLEAIRRLWRSRQWRSGERAKALRFSIASRVAGRKSNSPTMSGANGRGRCPPRRIRPTVPARTSSSTCWVRRDWMKIKPGVTRCSMRACCKCSCAWVTAFRLRFARTSSTALAPSARTARAPTLPHPER